MCDTRHSHCMSPAALPWHALQIQDDEQTESLLLEVTDLRACPKGLGLARADFCAPRASAPLGAPPLFAVRYLHQTKATLDVASVRPGGAVHEWVQRAGGAGVMLVRAASSAEVRHGKEVLEAGRRYIAGPVPGSPAKPGAQFRDSVLFPPPLADMQRAMAAQPALKVAPHLPTLNCALSSQYVPFFLLNGGVSRAVCALCTRPDVLFHSKYASHIWKLTVAVDHQGNIIWIGPLIMHGTAPDVIMWDKYGPTQKLGLFKNFGVGCHDGVYKVRLHSHTPFIGHNTPFIFLSQVLATREKE